ncbi:MAG: GyrI-like domain-containing protein [Burkholderiaceae bacterium]
MTPSIVAQPALRLVGLQILTRPMSPEIPALWTRFVARLPEIASPSEPGVTWGAMQDAGDHLVYLAAVQADAASSPPDMTLLDVPAGDYAVFEFPFGEIGKAYPFIFDTWLPGSGYVEDARPLLERYGSDFCPDQPASPMQVRVPVRPRA